MTYDDDAFCDNKSLMIVKKTGDGSGITALLSKQLQGMCLNRSDSCHYAQPPRCNIVTKFLEYAHLSVLIILSLLCT